MNWPVASRRLRQVIAQDPGPHKVHVGAGPVRLDGWINTDTDWSSDYWLNVTRPWPFPAGSVGHIYADNVIEHLPIQAGRAFLGHAFHALALGGRLRVVTPDARALAEAYLADPESFLRDMRRDGHQAEHGVDILRNAFSLWGHHAGYVYDELSLECEMRRAGLSSVTRFGLGESNDPALARVETRQAESYSAQVVLEATRE